MSNLTTRKAVIVFDCNHLIKSSIFGEITEEMLRDYMNAFFKDVFVDYKLEEEQGDFYNMTNPKIIMTQEELDTVRLTPEEEGYKLPTDDESILADFKKDGTDIKYLELEKRTRQLENEGLTRSDAQGVASAEGFDPDRERFIALAKAESAKNDTENRI